MGQVDRGANQWRAQVPIVITKPDVCASVVPLCAARSIQANNRGQLASTCHVGFVQRSASTIGRLEREKASECAFAKRITVRRPVDLIRICSVGTKPQVSLASDTRRKRFAHEAGAITGQGTQKDHTRP
eukprot:514897-Prymnesium_polylepis.1